MSEEKKFEKVMGQAVDRDIQRKWQQQYDSKAYNYFMQPAKSCQACGRSMEMDPATGQPKQMTEWERKWSVHRPCAENLWNQLDRNTAGPHGRRP